MIFVRAVFVNIVFFNKPSNISLNLITFELINHRKFITRRLGAKKKKRLKFFSVVNIVNIINNTIFLNINYTY